ncbi:MAG: hypothetical protein Q9182_005220 [Xanthomendoza sp. 2 TL-2023]
MSRQYTGHQEPLEFHRRSNSTREGAANYSSRASPQAYQMSRTSPLLDNESEKGDQQPRRRIGLAVNSFNAPNATLEYPYTNSSTLGLPVNIARSNTNSTGFYSGDYGLVQPSVPPYSGSSLRVGSMNGQQYSSMTSRHSHPSITNGYSYGSLNEDMFDYNQTPNYMLPAQDPQVSTTAYASHEMSRQWTPIANNRPPSLSFEHDSPYKYGASNFPYINSSSTSAIGPHDSLFSEVNSLSKGLPQHRDRTLPNPTKRASTSLEAGSNAYQKSGEFASYGPSPGLSHRSSVAWSPQTVAQDGSQGSVSSTSLSAFSGSVSGPVGSVSASPPADLHAQPTSSYGYMSLSSSPLHHQAVSVSRASETDPVNQSAEKRHRLLAQMPPTASAGQISLPHRAITNGDMYYRTKAWEAMNRPTTETSSSDHTLITGQPYQRLHQPPVNHNGQDPLPLDDQPRPIAPAPKKAVTNGPSRQN